MILLESCNACPRSCRVNRLKGEKGRCRSGSAIKVSTIGPHHGEEPPLSGTRGSGAVFFLNCNLKCSFCQNYQISQEGLGYSMSEEELAQKLLELQEQGCHNINLVSPSHFGPQILKALSLAEAGGLELPVVYNTNGYDSVEMLKLLEGHIEIYLPDIKYSDDENAHKYSGVKDYVKYNRRAIAEMFRQVGNLELDREGIAVKGMIVRHLVLPGDTAGSNESLKFLSGLSKDMWLSIMSQYRPCYRAIGHGILGRKLKPEEYERVLEQALALGFHNILVQEMGSSDVYLPDFRRANPFE